MIIYINYIIKEVEKSILGLYNQCIYIYLLNVSNCLVVMFFKWLKRIRG